MAGWISWASRPLHGARRLHRIPRGVTYVCMFNAAIHAFYCVGSMIPWLADFPELLELCRDAAWSFTRGLRSVCVGKCRDRVARRSDSIWDDHYHRHFCGCVAPSDWLPSSGAFILSFVLQQCPGRVLGISSRDPSVFKSNRLHVVIFQSIIIHSRYVP